MGCLPMSGNRLGFSQVTKKPKFVYVEGIRLSPALTQDSIVFSLNFDPLATDIVIDSYPGCGSSWVVQIVHLLLNNGHLGKIAESLTREVCYLEAEGNQVDSYRAPRIINTHLPFNGIAYNPSAKYIYIARNVKDCCVSIYHIMKAYPEDYQFQSGTFEDVFECFIRGEMEYNDYFDHLLPWWSYKNEPNILFLVFETMKKEPKEHVQIIAKFLGGVANDFIQDQNKLQSLLRLTNILFMKLKAREYASVMPKRKFFVREGVIGQWKNFFTGEQSRRMNNRFFQRTVDTPMNLLWKGMGVFD
ncbi:sulfotransferase 1C4-like [Dermacentor albipictus]|uniref:sulfotransferase 1C4-like n=1 Tax=Dermacentor albipictus TaxID=60249 RepID=UPI0031FDD5DE